MSAEDGVLVYTRDLENQQILIALNMTDQERVLRDCVTVRELLLTTYLDGIIPPCSGDIYLRENEGVIFKMLPDVS